jgi:meso-butanediol dehydrogenase / (S,S)-butanediol dehydrogenase / diacetyl reductase
VTTAEPGPMPASGLPPVSDAAPVGPRFGGRTALVTGGGNGIGRAVALRLASEGAQVVVADIDLAGARRTAALCRPRGQATAIRLDVRSARSVAALAKDVDRRFGRLDVLVNNAGIEVLGGVADVDPAAWDEVMAVNLRGTYLVSRGMLPLLLRSAESTGRSSIVNNASLMGLVSTVGLAAYCASKAGVVSLTRSMALDHATSGMRVNCVCPGIIHTPMLERRFEKGQDRRETDLVPPVHYIGRAEDVAAAILYLAADEARFVTGIALTIDGGVSAA